MTPTLRRVKSLASQTYPGKKVVLWKALGSLTVDVHLSRNHRVSAFGSNPTRLLRNFRDTIEWAKTFRELYLG